ncbi:MAG TPA: PQQ-binding-like beta-propeller repeat protein [Pirellulales bacterium]|jgi:outer membrane protein assembly factor BamB|nr:PQQ-binding-like beta-propeller repeat protein [Pirellulales bacterium]
MDLANDGLCRRPARALFRAAVIVTIVAILGRFAIRAHAQVAIMATADAAADDQANAPKGFAVLKADSKIVEMIEDFNRYSGKKSWELAFRALNSIDEANSRGMVPAGDGFMVPIRARVKQCLLQLPPEGRDAYRLFNDAAAKQLWDHVHDTRARMPSDELENLRKLVEVYPLTSVGDLAADRLGDALFEQGNFAGAEQMWRLVVETFPDSQLPIAKLQVKRCIALSQLGRRDALAVLVAQVRDQYADQKVTIGGQEVSAAEFAQSLVSNEAPNQPKPAADAEVILLPTADEPVWQIRVVGPNLAGMTDPQTGMPMSSSNIRTVPGSAVDDKRFYGNWLGTIYAADLETGKMLWRTGKFTDATQQVTNYLQQGVSFDSFYMVSAGGKLLAMRQGSKNLLGELLGGQSSQDNNLHLECLDAASGKTVWSARGLGVTVVSVPYVVDGVAYVAGIAANNSTMNLMAISMTTGQTAWQVQLGTPQNARNWRGGFTFGGPNMLAVGGVLYVATNNGALLAVGLASHQVEWALQHDTKPPTDNNQRFWFNGMMMTPTETPGTLLDEEGVFYLKDGSGRLLYALDPGAPSVKWKRPISADESVAAVDGQTAYLLGHELSALDLKSRKLLWSTKIPGESAALKPLVCPEHVFVPTARGIFDIDPANGDIRRVFRGADRESGLCRLLLAGDKLIAISDTAVTAYPIQREKATKLSSQTTK